MIDVFEHKTPQFCVAPMMDWTDRHCRAFHRILSRRARLFTEMVTSAAIVHGDRDHLLGFSPEEHPVVVQLGGSDPAELAEAARIAEQFGYDEINLNIGCPSDRVQSGRFGACLMAEPELVGACVAAMLGAVKIPVTVKCRIGIDDQDEDADFSRFISVVSDHGCETFYVHARKAWLEGLSPKENRDIPPLNHDRVYRLKTARPDLTVVINGGIPDLDDGMKHLGLVDGIMLGRAAYQTPWLLADVDGKLFGRENPVAGGIEAVEKYLPYIETQLSAGQPLHRMTRHMLGLFHGRPGARLWRRHLSENAHGPGTGTGIIREALDLVQPLLEAA